jgi:hypothetical protein
VRVPLLFGAVVVCDRYAADAAIELRERLPEDDRLARRVLSLIEALAPRARFAYVLDLEPRAALSATPSRRSSARRTPSRSRCCAPTSATSGRG